ncbi:MAG: beta-galactosidase small subunit-related protein, partial [Planctomycetota bacterium]
RYESTVADQHFDYILPVECGGHEDTRWLELKNAEGAGLRVQGSELFHFDVHHNTVADYAAATHLPDLVERDATLLNLDHLHTGLGGDVGWRRCLHEEYQIKPGRWHFGFTIEAF